MLSRLPLPVFAGLALGVVLGYVLGGIGPRRELAAVTNEVRRLEMEMDRGGTGWRSPVPGLDRILRTPGAPGGSERLGEPQPTGATDGEGEPAPGGLDGGVAREGWRDRWRSGSRRTREERYDAFSNAAAVQRVRRIQSRAALMEQADLSEEEEVELDTLLGDLNDSLAGYGEEILSLAARDEPPPPRDLLGITHDVTGVLGDAQRRLEELLGPERRAAIDESALEIWNHVDLDRLEPAARSALERRDR